ncbi:hypothetical protein PAPYR_2694 [Paratrimastix pyriformis]|uniref:Uncharacterized protein n=1 Tax=Paratrimastix pyriformis TaxID=342808 RepID=A0ABQ8UU32_9EUKA|nr:hypothetical protein PAPYR_2694 [Paratrimastix pyriformis]
MEGLGQDCRTVRPGVELARGAASRTESSPVPIHMASRRSQGSSSSPGELHLAQVGRGRFEVGSTTRRATVLGRVDGVPDGQLAEPQDWDTQPRGGRLDQGNMGIKPAQDRPRLAEAWRRPGEGHPGAEAPQLDGTAAWGP